MKVKCTELAKVLLNRYVKFWQLIVVEYQVVAIISPTLDLQILDLAYNKSDIERRVHSVIDKFAERGLRSLAVAYQVM